MANQEQLSILKQGVEVWNQWRKEHTEVRPDLSEAILSRSILARANLSGSILNRAQLEGTYLSKANLKGAVLTGANLGRANLSDADLGKADLRGIYFSSTFPPEEVAFSKANFSGANLSEANFSGVSLRKVNLSKADLSKADLSKTDLSKADLSKANLSGADLSGATLVHTDLSHANLTGSRIFGISAWDVNLEDATQNNLIITDKNHPTVTVDNLEVAQSIYLLLNNKKIRDVINILTTKAVLILGRFTPERKAVLDALREALRICGYLPILFDFEKPSSRDLTETVSILAHLAWFIVADLTEPSSIPKELEAIVPTLAVPVQPLLEGATRPYAMFQDYWKYQWVLEIYRYNGLEELLASLQTKVIEPAERKARELARLRAQAFE